MTAPRTLDSVPLGQTVTITRIGGERGFRRRLMEMGLLPGCQVTPVNLAPLGDPLQISVRDTQLSIRRHEASHVVVRP